MKMIALIAGPPVMAVVWWVFSRAYAHIFEGSRLSEVIRRRQVLGFWIVLGIFYAIALWGYLAWPRLLVR
jgi:hypothetical protein